MHMAFCSCIVIYAFILRYPFPTNFYINFLPLQQQIQITQMKESEKQLTMVQYEVKVRQQCCQELSSLKDHKSLMLSYLLQEADEYYSSCWLIN